MGREERAPFYTWHGAPRGLNPALSLITIVLGKQIAFKFSFKNIYRGGSSDWLWQRVPFSWASHGEPPRSCFQTVNLSSSPQSLLLRLSVILDLIQAQYKVYTPN